MKIKDEIISATAMLLSIAKADNIVEDSELPYDGCPKNTKFKAFIRLKKVWSWSNKWGLFFEIIRIDIQD